MCLCPLCYVNFYAKRGRLWLQLDITGVREHTHTQGDNPRVLPSTRPFRDRRQQERGNRSRKPLENFNVASEWRFATAIKMAFYPSYPFLIFGAVCARPPTGVLVHHRRTHQQRAGPLVFSSLFFFFLSVAFCYRARAAC